MVPAVFFGRVAFPNEVGWPQLFYPVALGIGVIRFCGDKRRHRRTQQPTILERFQNVISNQLVVLHHHQEGVAGQEKIGRR